MNEQARAACQAAAAWIEQHFQPLHMEHRVYSREAEYAGTIDVFGKVDGEPAIVDFKAAEPAKKDLLTLESAAKLRPVEISTSHRGQIVASPHCYDGRPSICFRQMPSWNGAVNCPFGGVYRAFNQSVRY